MLLTSSNSYLFGISSDPGVCFKGLYRWKVGTQKAFMRGALSSSTSTLDLCVPFPKMDLGYVKAGKRIKHPRRQLCGLGLLQNCPDCVCSFHHLLVSTERVGTLAVILSHGDWRSNSPIFSCMVCHFCIYFLLLWSWISNGCEDYYLIYTSMENLILLSVEDNLYQTKQNKTK